MTHLIVIVTSILFVFLGLGHSSGAQGPGVLAKREATATATETNLAAAGILTIAALFLAKVFTLAD